jgi:predicted 3-demethylubiquinone-9 3-methyltransferase (glyoxalase superfamily)
MPAITPNLWFDTEGEEAANHYVVPTVLDELISDPDQENAQQAMLGMVKLDIAELQRAFDGADNT